MADIGQKGIGVANIGSLPKTSRVKNDIEIVSITAKDYGVEVFAKAWDKAGEPIGFGDGTVEIERFRLVMSDNDKWTNGFGGKTIQEQLLQRLEEIIFSTGKDGNNIKAGKVGNTTTSVDMDTTNTKFHQITNTTYATAHDATTAGVNAYASSSGWQPCRHDFVSGSTYFIGRADFQFDTSAIADTDIVSGLTITMYSASSNGGNSESDNIEFLDNTNNSNLSSPVIAGDFDQYGTAEIMAETLSNWTNIGANVTSGDFGTYDVVNKTGNTKIGIRLGKDVSNTTPTTANTVLRIATSSDVPYITVTHAAPPSPAYATDLNDIFTDSSAAWGLINGGKQTDPETDDFIQGSNCWSHDPFSSRIEGGMYNSAETIATDDAVYVWIKADISAAMATHANGGMQICIGDTSPVVTPNYDAWYVRGSDDYQYGGWICIPVDPTSTPSTTVGSPTGTSWFGARWNIPSTGPNKGYPFKIDAMRHGRQIEVTSGSSTFPTSWGATATYDSATARQWGICQPTNTGAAIQGIVYWGTASASVYSRDSNQTIVINDTEFTVTDFTQIIFAHASNDVVWDNVGLIALGTNNRGIIDVTANGTVEWTNSVFQDIDVTNLLSGCTFDGSKWIGTNEVDAGGATMLNAEILTPTVAVDSYGLLWNVATDPDGKLDGMNFSMGSNAHHAIEFGLTSPTTIGLNDMTFSGFGADDTTSSELNFLRTTGTVTVNLSGMTTPTYKSAGADIVFVNAVPVKVTVTTEGGTAIVGARVRMEAASGGDLPSDDVVTISSTTTLATVTHTAHGLATGDKVVIRGANQDEYNKIATITVTTANAYTYAIDSFTGSGTGTIKATSVILDDVTGAGGILQDAAFNYTSDQPVPGVVRSGSGSPYYKTSQITGTITDTGYDQTILLISDE